MTNITLSIQADNADELKVTIQSLAGQYTAPVEIGGAPANVDFNLPAPPKKEKPAKKAAEPPTEPPAATETAAAEGDGEIDLQQVREAAMKVRDGGNPEKVKKSLEALGVTRVTDLEKSQYSKFLEKLAS